ncbi:hypothetical protein EST38_g8258 [Candolleomyces aberdarensis]|uniref:Pyridoxamine 5'-phosphate oxidase Alr4036 family FMN-binding domain-containing protein n=1 Tax=Candolleomyces aberdarensis TaxID=2316362 RepID=A0A4Q2DF95_9AGAR|nr:hypothetical protein EST38_g8258 [Candolleomyces aberdarensis]
MPRTNSLSDSEGRSLTPDLEDEGFEVGSPTYGIHETAAASTAGSVPKGASTAFGGHALTNIMSRVSHHTHHTHQSKAAAIRSPTSAWKQLSPKEKFKAAVRKVIAMGRGATLLGEVRQIGAEPGVDPTKPSSDLIYGQLHKECKIEVVDYSAVRCNYKVMENEEFVDMMDGEETWKPQPWVKCRWINIAGVSWDVIKALALRYSLHPLALEDVINKNNRTRSKADYYTKHLFLRVMCHELHDGDAEADAHDDPAPRSESPEPMQDGTPEKEKLEEPGTETDGETLQASFSKSKNSTMRRRPLLPRTLADLPIQRHDSGSALAQLIKKDGKLRAARTERKAAEAMLEDIKKGIQHVGVKVKPMFIFMYRDGTVITIQRQNVLDFTAPISQRLRQRDTVLRKSIDPSLLVHALLDLTVDKALEVIDEYHAKINHFERKILLKPNMKTVRELHILSGDLILHKRTLDPIKTMIFGLRRYDIDRCAALIDMSDPANKDIKIVGYMSHKAKIYLADVYDHMDFILTSLDMFAGIMENLIDYSFNIASYEMNEVMRRLTLATIIFFPLTLLTGYFGMNFQYMWSVNEQSDRVFWIIAAPVMAIVIPIFLWSDILRGIRYMRKRMSSSKAGRVDSGLSGTFPPAHLPLVVTSTDLRTPKVSQIKANSKVEFAWWINGESDDDKTRIQFRISGKAFLIPSPTGPSKDLYGEFEKTVEDSFKLPRSEAQGYLGLQSLSNVYQQSSPKGFWESQRQASFRSLSAYMKASWCKPPPGTPLSLYGGPEAAKKWPQRVEEPSESDSPEEREKKQKNWDEALGNFVLVLIEPVEVDFVDLGVQPNKRFRFWRDEKGVWGEQELVP